MHRIQIFKHPEWTDRNDLMDQDHGILIDSDFGEVNSAEDSFPHQGTKKAVKRMKFLEEFTSSIEVSNAKIGINRYLVDTITSQLDAKSNHGFDLTEVLFTNLAFLINHRFIFPALNTRRKSDRTKSFTIHIY